MTGSVGSIWKRFCRASVEVALSRMAGERTTSHWSARFSDEVQVEWLVPSAPGVVAVEGAGQRPSSRSRSVSKL